MPNFREFPQPGKAPLKRAIRLSPCPHRCPEPPIWLSRNAQAAREAGRVYQQRVLEGELAMLRGLAGLGAEDDR